MILQNRRPEQDAETADPTEKTADAAEKTGDAAEETGDAAETSAARANLDPDEGGPALASPPPPLVHVPAGEVCLGRCRGGTSPAGVVKAEGGAVLVPVPGRAAPPIVLDGGGNHVFSTSVANAAAGAVCGGAS